MFEGSTQQSNFEVTPGSPSTLAPPRCSEPAAPGRRCPPAAGTAPAARPPPPDNREASGAVAAAGPGSARPPPPARSRPCPGEARGGESAGGAPSPPGERLAGSPGASAGVRGARLTAPLRLAPSARARAALPPAAFAHDRAAILRLTNYCTSFGAGGEPGTPDAAARSAHSHPPGASLPRGGCAGRPGSGGRCLSLPGRERGPSRSAAPPVRRRTPARGRPGPAEAAGGYPSAAAPQPGGHRRLVVLRSGEVPARSGCGREARG